MRVRDQRRDPVNSSSFSAFSMRLKLLYCEEALPITSSFVSDPFERRGIDEGTTREGLGGGRRSKRAERGSKVNVEEEGGSHSVTSQLDARDVTVAVGKSTRTNKVQESL